MSRRLVSQPHNLSIALFPHQRAAIWRMELLENQPYLSEGDHIDETALGFYTDIVGYGKTLAMIGLICRNQKTWDLEQPFIRTTTTIRAGGLVTRTTTTRYEKLHPTLVLVGLSVVQQWQEELEYAELSVATVTTRRSADQLEVQNYDVILVTPRLYNHLISLHSCCAWRRFIFDEPSHIRVRKMKAPIAGFTWMVTATPNLITTQYHNCPNNFMRDLLGPGIQPLTTEYQSLMIRNDPAFVRESFVMPETEHHTYLCDQALYRALDGLASAKIMNLIAAGNISGALRSLGVKSGNLCQILRQQKTEAIANLQRIERLSPVERVQLELLTQQLQTLDERIAELWTGGCHICFEPLTNSGSEPVLEPHCQNLFCGACLLTWLEKKPTCPLCRHPVRPDELVKVRAPSASPSRVQEESKDESRRKPEVLVEIIQAHPDGKFVIFSSQDETYGLIRRTLNEHDIECSEVKGSAQQRARAISKFRSGSLPVLFLNSGYNGAGINLQETTDIILYHRMSEDTIRQLLGRANRVGRTVPLTVHNLQIRME